MKQVHIKLSDYLKGEVDNACSLDDRTIQRFVTRAIIKAVIEVYKREGNEQKHTEKKDSPSTKVKKMGHGI